MKINPILSRIPHDALAIYVFLDERATLDTKVGVTQGEIARATRLSKEAVRESLGWLMNPSFADANLTNPTFPSPLIKIIKFSKAHKVILLEPWNDGREVRFTFDDTDERRLAVVEAELRRLALSNKTTHRLSLFQKGETQSIIAEIEADLGRPVSVEESFLLGGICTSFGPQRLKAAWRRHAPTLDKPIVSLYAMFMKERFGKMTYEKEDKDVDPYTPYVPDREPV